MVNAVEMCPDDIVQGTHYSYYFILGKVYYVTDFADAAESATYMQFHHMASKYTWKTPTTYRNILKKNKQDIAQGFIRP